MLFGVDSILLNVLGLIVFIAGCVIGGKDSETTSRGGSDGDGVTDLSEITSALLGLRAKFIL
jgi:hypothetical protein